MKLLYYLPLIAPCGSSIVHGYNYICTDCPPTISPAPTESPAPSPSPSETPTTTQHPSTSLAPSIQPTDAPPSSLPSSLPTDLPTESPAPSPSPSENPTNHPTVAPSISFMPTISLEPTTSTIPSTQPTQGPSAAPTSSPSSRPTIHPTLYPSAAPTISEQPSVSFSPSNGEVFLVASNNRISLEGFDTLLGLKAKEDFENLTLAFLSDETTFVPNGNEVSFQSVRITGQSLHAASSKSPSVATLTILFDVAAFVRFTKHESFDYNVFVEDIFNNTIAFAVLRKELQTGSSFFGNNTFLNKNNGVHGNVGTSTFLSNPPLVFACLGISLAIGGVAVFLCFRRRKHGSLPAMEQRKHSGSYDVDDEDDYPFSMKPTESYDSASSGDHVSEASYPSAGYPIAKQFQVKPTVRSVGLGAHCELYTADTIDMAYLQTGPNNMYRPAFLPTESNIEIPITPLTNYDASHFSPKDGDTCDLDHCQDEQSVEQPSSAFRFGWKQKSRQRKDKETEVDTVRPTGLPSEQQNCEAQSSSTVNSLFSGPTRLLKTVWQISQSSSMTESSILEGRATSSSYIPDLPSLLHEEKAENVNKLEAGPVIPDMPNESPCCTSNATSIKVMNEVAYLHSQDMR